MLFNSPLFLFIFLPLIFAIFLAAPRRWRNIALLVGSCGFYAWGEPRFIFVVLLSAVFDWLLGCQLAVTVGTTRAVVTTAATATTAVAGIRGTSSNAARTMRGRWRPTDSKSPSRASSTMQSTAA